MSALVRRWKLAGLVAIASVACVTRRVPHVDWSRVPSASRQAVLVVPHDGTPTKGDAILCERRRDDGWHRVGAAIPVVLGRSGVASAGAKKEGDGRTPSGIFPLKSVFGYATSADTTMPYSQVTPDDLWVDDVSSPDYNRWVKAPSLAKSFEVLRRSDQLYERAIVVGYNTDPIEVGKGSAIFIHVWRSPESPTAGCIAMDLDALEGLVRWLRPESRPVVVISESASLSAPKVPVPERISIPAGVFTMGGLPGDDTCDCDQERPHQESVAPFRMDKSEVTVGAYQNCVDAGACTADDDDVETCNWGRRPDHPMNCVDWHQARAFCTWAGGRLPSADEWEYAAKGATDRIYPWGNDPVTDKRANFCDRNCPSALPPGARKLWEKKGWIDTSADDGWAGTAPVGSYPSGNSAWGVQDMVGNVSEWTATKYGEGTYQLRGGSWSDSARSMRVSIRIGALPSTRNYVIGFRCVE